MRKRKGQPMNATIVCTSVSHGNTMRIAETMGRVLAARVVDPEQIDPAELSGSDLVGFGSGIFNMDFHPRLREFVASLPTVDRQAAFVFATSGLPVPPFKRYTRHFAQALERKGYDVVGTFICRGFDTWLPFRIVGGIAKGRPTAAELDAAREFAEGLRHAR